jgi:hydrogenase maturation protein HypF
MRRSRGYAPQPLTLPRRARRPLLACGAELKNTFCLARERYAFISHHIGDLENYQSLRAFSDGIEHFRRLFEVDPQLVVHDLHPEYLSTKYAFDLRGVELIGVQHHHAHIAACLADNGEQGPAIGVAFDGLGYGADAETIWGGEFWSPICGAFSARRISNRCRCWGTAAINSPGGWR